MVTEESPAHFAPLEVSDVWPSFNHFVTPGAWPSHVYGMPSPGEGVKVGFHGVGDEVDPDARPLRTDKHAAVLAEYVREWMPGLDAATAVPISCTYTSTPDEAFVLDRVGRIVVGAGFSGQGFKFAPGVGAVLADLVLDPRAQRSGGLPPALSARHRARTTRFSSQTGASDSETAPSGAEHEEPIERPREPAVVRDGEHGALEAVQRLLERFGRDEVEVVGRLVQQQQRRARQLEQQDLEPRLLPARKCLETPARAWPTRP